MRSQKKKGMVHLRRLFSLVPGLCLGTLALISAAGAAEVRLGVVRSPENATQWGGITNRLNESGVAYCVVDLQNVQRGTDLTGPTVLLLPNVESLTQEQAIALEAWMSQGGRVIATGPVGNLSPPGVRQMLRSLLGAYWAFPLSESVMVQPLRTRTQEWVSRELAGSIRGGVVIPTGLNSQTAATWSGPEDPPAVVTTNRVTFLGWRWGVDAASSAALDRAWLMAALNRYGKLPQAGTTKPPTSGNCVAPNSLPPIAAAPSPSPQLGASRSQPASSTPRSNSPARPVGTATPRNTPARPSAVPIPVPPPPPPTRATPQTADPTQQIAAAGISVSPDARTISASEAIAMQQELENLIGRVESALLTANAATSKPGEPGSRAIAQEPQKKETLSPTTGTLASTTALAPQNSTLNTLREAREALQALPQMIANRDYRAARQKWVQTRQSLWNLYPTDRPNAQPEIRAIWLDRGTIVRAKSEQGLARIFDRLAAAGINTVFMETLNASYTIYPSQVAPEQNPLTRGWDPLASGVKLAHERGMELHAWVWTFAAGNQRHNALLNQPDNYPGPVLAAHPDWANYDRRGNMIPAGQTKPFLDPANPEVRRYLLRLFDEIVTRYKVDGLQLDYIRYPFQDPSRGATYGYGTAARQQFQQMTGVDPLTLSPGDRNWQKWTQFRTQQINSFVAEVSQMLRQRRSNLILSVAVFAYPEQERIEKLQQNWEVWARRGDVDLIVPMAYAADTNRFQQLTQPWLTRGDLGSALVLPGIQLLNLPEVGAIDQIQLVRDFPSGGYSLFAAEHLSNQLQTIFSRTQGTAPRSSKDPIPHRQPFAAAAARFSTLEREWSFLVETNQLRLPEAAKASWRTQTEELSAALNKLAKEPSPANLTAASKSLTNFRSQFRAWMRSYSIQNSYQVQTWDNRLASLERLLSYGERVVLNRQAPPAAQR